MVLAVELGALALRPKPNKTEQARKALDNIVRLQKEMQH